MTVRGAIYYHSNFEFEDGERGKKLLVLLNTPGQGEPFLFVKTTSRQHLKTTDPGCQQRSECYFIPAGKTFFRVDTWIQLFQIYILPPDDIEKNNDMKFQDNYLDNKIIDDIINCLLETQKDDLSPVEKDLITPRINRDLLKLKDKFNKGRT